MNTNDPLYEAMLKLASAIQHADIDAKSREISERAEALIRGAKLVEEFSALRNDIAAEMERLNRIQQAHEWMKAHMPKSVATFGGSDGAFGWTGTDAAGNRVTWKVEPPAVAAVGEGDAPKSPAKSEPVITTLKIEVDDSQVRAALEPVQQLTIAATEAEAALVKLWNIQAVMRNGPPYAGVGKATGGSESNGAALGRLSKMADEVFAKTLSEERGVEASQLSSPRTE